MKKYIVEFIGTFFLVFTVGMVVSATASPVLGALAIGSSLMVMVYAGGHISGGHYNPAVTLGVWLRGKCESRDVLPYWVAQLLAAIVAAVAVALVLQKTGFFAAIGSGPSQAAVLPSVLAEFIGTFALVWVVLNTATAKGTEGNSFYGLAIGFTVFTCAVSVGSISGGAFNPAVGLGVLTMGIVGVKQFMIYLIADMLAGLCAALAFNAINGKE